MCCNRAVRSVAGIKVEEISLATFNSSVGIHTSPMKVEGMDDIDDEEDEDGNPKAKKKAGKGGKQAKKEEAVYYRISVKVTLDRSETSGHLVL